MDLLSLPDRYMTHENHGATLWQPVCQYKHGVLYVQEFFGPYLMQHRDSIT